MTSACAVSILAAALAELNLLGVVVSHNPERSTALLSAEGRVRAVSTGESAFGARVLTIAPDRIVVEAAGERREIALAREPARPVLAPPVPIRSVISEPVALADTPTVRTLDRADVERRLMREIPRILAETALLPVTDAGNVTGFTLARLPDGTVLSEVGLQSGDVLTEINGTPIDSLATLASLYGRLSNQNEIRAVVLRGGSTQTLTVHLR
jgi:general secretion pathway protein C